MNTKELDVCIHCGEPKKDHHEFEPIKISASCICDIEEWGNKANIPPVCNTFTPFTDDDVLCKICEHEKGCHVIKE